MPYFNLHNFLSLLNDRKGDNTFVLQVGAMDGKTFDPIHPYMERFGWCGVMVEPIAEHFAALQETYRGNARIHLVNAAITGHDGRAVMHNVPLAHVRDNALPAWAAGLSSFYLDRNAIAFPDIQGFVVTQDVPCMTVATLLRECGVQAIDVLQIDAEGHDYQILKQFDLRAVRPAVINMEFVNLPKDEQAACKKFLDANGYFYAKGGYDLLAVSYEFLGDVVTQPANP